MMKKGKKKKTLEIEEGDTRTRMRADRDSNEGKESKEG